MSLTRRKLLLKTSMALAGSAVGTAIYASEIEPHWVEIVRRPLPVKALPDSLSGKSLVQISDLHVGQRVDDAYLVDTLERVHNLAPDILVMTGDYMTYYGRKTLERVERVLAHLPLGRHATIAILGNHDYAYGWSQIAIADQVTACLQNLGVMVLRNEKVSVQGLEIVGLDDLWAPRFAPRKILNTLHPDQPALVLCHNPDAVDLPVWGGYHDWILCGHTHGGQCKPPFLPPPILPVKNKRYTAGEFELAGDRRLYINRGLGHLMQVRFNVRPEITVFSLERA